MPALEDSTWSTVEIRTNMVPGVWKQTIGNCLPVIAGLWTHMPLDRFPLIPWYRCAFIQWGWEIVTWGVKWYSVGISGESRFCLHAYNDCLQMQCKSREQYFPVHIHPWHTNPTHSIMEINIIMVLVFVKITLNSIIVQLTLLTFLQVEDNVLF